MPVLHFEPSARLQRFLGRELIADPNLALVEFVKNAYDASASNVRLHLHLHGNDRKLHTIQVEDNGIGMDLASFEHNWMHPGFSEKARFVGGTEQRRVPIGDKGLGRLAAARLGDVLEVFTRQASNDPWLHVLFNWQAFEDMDRALSEIDVSYDFHTAPEQHSFEGGTILLVRDLHQRWSGRLPGRKVPGRSDTRLGRLREDLEILFLPEPAESEGFQISLTTDPTDVYADQGIVPRLPTGAAGYRFDFALSVEEGELVSRRVLMRSPAIATRLALPPETSSESREPVAAEYAWQSGEERPRTLRCGPFSGSFLYAPAAITRARELSFMPGVFLYRDSARVDPYGHAGNDWLGARARKASLQGYAAIQPNLLSGYVRISKEETPDLMDMSSRQGLVENDAYEDFVAHARAEFDAFEKLIFDEYVEPNWEQPETRERVAAQQATGIGKYQLRALVHRIRQPVSGLGADIEHLRLVIEDLQVPDAQRQILASIHERSRLHLSAIDEALVRFFDSDLEPTLGLFSVRSAVQSAIAKANTLASSHGVTLRLLPGHDPSVLAPESVVVEAIAELITNGIQAQSRGGKEAWVQIGIRKDNGTCYITVRDNGCGISQVDQASLFTGQLDNKGRPGVGLRTARDGLALFGARLLLTHSDATGTEFEIMIPSGEMR